MQLNSWDCKTLAAPVAIYAGRAGKVKPERKYCELNRLAFVLVVLHLQLGPDREMARHTHETN